MICYYLLIIRQVLCVLSIGDSVYIEEILDDQVNIYKSRLVEEFDHTIHLDIPFSEITGRNALFQRESIYKVYFLTKKSLLYSSNLTYKHPIKDPIPVLVFSKPANSELKTEQRRQFFRIATSTEITVLPLEDEFSPFETLSQDISAGGVAINVPQSLNFKPDQKIKLSITLKYENSMVEEVIVESTIVRTQESETFGKHLLSLMFNGLSSQARQKIVKYTLEQQRIHIHSMKVDG